MPCMAPEMLQIPVHSPLRCSTYIISQTANTHRWFWDFYNHEEVRCLGFARVASILLDFTQDTLQHITGCRN